MQHRDYLLFIDSKPVPADLIDYFLKFDIHVEHQTDLQPLATEQGPPLAILIHWRQVKEDPGAIRVFFDTYLAPLFVIDDEQNEKACITALEHGADDFILTPLHPRELQARISAIGRRIMRSQQHIAQQKEVFSFANWRLFPTSRQVFDKNGHELSLSTGEYDLLLVFIQNAQHVIERERLQQITKNCDLNPLNRRIDVQISRLRQKIEIDAKNPVLIKTIRNEGYLFTSVVDVSNDQ